MRRERRVLIRPRSMFNAFRLGYLCFALSSISLPSMSSTHLSPEQLLVTGMIFT
ncbi:hypothetical protein NXC24_PC00455 (plasmid) [Rhizobium sp. NXC24]|nr:hypothetical protein NXC24_PC00455 [Rhizobium sp. NXC24]